MRKDLGTSREGEIDEEGCYNIMDEQPSQNIIKSMFVLEDGSKIMK
jgi:hypothetical protein